MTKGGKEHTLNDMTDLSGFLQKAIAKGVDDALIVAPAKVFTAPWVVMKCRFGCPGYGGRLCCPPYSPAHGETRAVLDSYSRAILCHRHWQKGYGVVSAFNEALVDLERELFLSGYYKALAMGSGPCTLCVECEKEHPCRHTDRARPSMEACGIDVFATARESGFSIEVVKNHRQARDIFGIVLVE